MIDICKIFYFNFKIGFDFTFTMWMDARAELREIISRGMKSFNWD